MTPFAGPRVTLPTSAGALPHAIAFVLGFHGLHRPRYQRLRSRRPDAQRPDLLRQVGGVVLIVLGLNLMGVTPHPAISAGRTSPAQPEFGQPPLGGAAARSPFAAFALGSVFALGWTPCVGPTLGAILTLSAISVSPQVVLLLLAYSLGLGVPVPAARAGHRQRAGRFTRPILKYGRQIELIGGGLVVIIGLAIIFDWLSIFARAFSFLWPQV